MPGNSKRSLRITIPALKAKSPALASEEIMEDQPSKRKRKVPNRYLDAGGYEEEEDAVAAAEPERKVARTSTAGRSRRQSTASEPSAAPVSAPSASNLFDEDDVEDARAAASRVESEHDDAHSDRSARHSSPVRTKTKTPRAPKGKASADAASAKKKGRANKRAVVVSESEEEEAFMDTAADVLAEETDEDEYMSEEEEKPVKKGKGKGKAALKRTASEKAPPKKKAAEVSEGAKGMGKAAKKPLASSASKHDVEPIIDVVGGSPPQEPPVAVSKSGSVASKQDLGTPVAAPTTAPKKKLPTINKVKGATTSGLSTPTTPSTVTKKPAAATADTRDLDLNDSSIYQQLFSNKKGANVNIARPDMEERRKEISRMREEAKAKRKTENVHSFDLQAQAEKIARFEENLRNTQALYPNVIAGRWKQNYDENKRMQREQEQWALDTAMKEEGEVV